MALADNLVAFWPLDEASGNALDAHGSNDLTDTNTVTSGTGNTYSTARDFESGNTEYFTLADNTDLSTGDVSFGFAFWVKLESEPGTSMGVVSKGNWGSGGEYRIRWNAYTFMLEVCSGAGFANYQSVMTPADYVLGNWYFVVGQHDASGNQLRLSVNDGTVYTASHSAGVWDGAGAFEVGRSLGTGQTWDGLIGPGLLRKGSIFSAGEITELYNAGAGLTYDAITGGGGDVVENATPVTTAASVVAPAVTLSQAPAPVTCAASVVGPTVSLSHAGTPVTAAGSVVTPGTALGYAASPVGTVVTVPAPSVSGSAVTESPDPVTTTSSVVTPGSALENAPAATGSVSSVVGTATAGSVSPPPVTAGSGAVGPVLTLTVAGAAVTTTATVPAATVSQEFVEAPSPVVTVAAVPAHLTVLAYAAGAVTTVVTVPSVTAGSPAVGVGGWCVAGAVYCPGAAGGSVYGHGAVAVGVFAPGATAGRVT